MLLDESLDENCVTKIKEFCFSEEVVTDFHYLRTRTSANINFVDIHLVFFPEILLLTAHQASDRIENKIRDLDKSKEWIINIHLDPYDDSEENVLI
jgi:divalent metal cation (Fe/Co/Zn/Cd) transporter